MNKMMVYPTLTKVGIKKAVFPTNKWIFNGFFFDYLIFVYKELNCVLVMQLSSFLI